MPTTVFFRLTLTVVISVICRPTPSSSFALLTHEAIIDGSWEKAIQPLLKQKYPGATEEELKTAHAYVYGGAIIPDIGYYPLGSRTFSNLVHYVRSGDFINTMLDEARNINEYAFALGVLCHYVSDAYGHRLGTNKAVAALFPKLKKRYGDEVTYEQDRNAHSRVEFGFDVIQTARGNYKSDAYHDFIGFQIADSVLDRAFLKTYGVHMKDIFSSLPVAVAVFRFSVKIIIPELTKNAWRIKNSFITELNPLATEKNYHYKVNKKNYRKEFKRPKIYSAAFIVVMSVLPKYGPLSRFKPMIPSPEVEKLFKETFGSILAHYSASVKKLGSKDAAFKNIDLDTGEKTTLGEYKLTSKTYYWLLRKLMRGEFTDVDESLKKNITAYYKNGESFNYGVSQRKGKRAAGFLEQLNAPEVDQITRTLK